MARIRTIKPEFWESEKVGSLTVGARLNFVGLISLSDDEGRGRGNLSYLLRRLHPYSTDVNLESMKIAAEELEKSGLVKFYKSGGSNYYFLPGWRKNQRLEKPNPSEFPAPPGHSGESIGAYPSTKRREQIYARDQYRCQYCDADLHGQTRRLSLDHVIPFSQGGTNRDQNLATACKSCNSKKKDRTPAEAGMTWPDGLGHAINTDVNHTLTPPLTTSGPGMEGKGQERKGMEGRGKSASLPAQEPDATPSEPVGETKSSGTTRTTAEGLPGPLRLARFLRNLVLDNDPKARIPAEGSKEFVAWVREADLLLRKDGRACDEAVRVLRWALDDEFWKANIMSMGKFRKQYSTLMLSLAREPRKDHGEYSSCRACEVRKPTANSVFCEDCRRCSRCGRSDPDLRLRVRTRTDGTKAAICTKCEIKVGTKKKGLTPASEIIKQ